MGMEGELCPSFSLPAQDEWKPSQVNEGGRRRRRRRKLILTFSLLSNLLLLLMVFFPIPIPRRPFLGLGPGHGWTHEASVAAEKAASYTCSGHGEVYIDTLAGRKDGEKEEGFASCECHECYTGPDCSRFITDCKANVESGDPLVFAPYWKANAKESAVVVPGWYRMSYTLVEGVKLVANVLPGLEREIRKLHALVGNAVTEGRYILVGIGSTQLLNAAVASIAATTTPFPSNVVASVPFYSLYELQTEEFQTLEYKWSGDAKDYASGNPGNGPFIEFVTAPNNPDGKMETPILNGTNMFTIYDHAYYWPHFTAITKKSDHNVMIFTLSKVTGHAGSRLGWAIVKDYAVFQEMVTRVQLNILSVAREAQLRATQLLKAVNEGYSNANEKEDKEEEDIVAPTPAYYVGKHKIFHFAYAEMSYRWRVLSAIFESSDRFTLQHLEPGYCSFFGKVTGPSPGYAWVKCEREEEKNCTSVFDKAGIIGRSGSKFGADDRFIRLSLLSHDSTFDNLVKHLSLLVTPPTLSLSKDS